MRARHDMGHSRAARAFIALAVAVACLSGVAYAATRPEQGRPLGNKAVHPTPKDSHGPPRPRFIEVPPSGGLDPDVQFRFHVPPPEQPATAGGPGPGVARPAPWRRFECRVDGGEWRGCSSPVRLQALQPGGHSFAVRALNRRGLNGEVARYRWALLEPRDFTIEPLVSTLDALMPGAPAQQLPVRVENPNPVPIEVTSLTVAVAPAAPACAADPNFAVTPSSVSPTSPLTVPAGGSTTLPSAAATAPTLALRELPVDQNPCQGTSVRLDFSGEARG
ncbi:MAG TPA: hypothetical protein VFI17_00910 [Solirubrobacterales bacterium]|nr:hypothetical protein [Solirubrobacterales bacterium]